MPPTSSSKLSALSARVAQLEQIGASSSDDARLTTFGAHVQQALNSVVLSTREDLFAHGRAAAADAKAAIGTVQDLHDRVASLEMMLATALQSQARLAAAVERVRQEAGAHGGPPSPAAAVADAAAASAKQAQEAAQTAEIASATSVRAMDAMVKRHQKELDESRAREKRLEARLDALTAAIAEQGTAATRACAQEAEARQRDHDKLLRRFADLEAMQGARLLALETGGKGAAAELRSLRLALRTLAIAVGQRPREQ